MKVYERVLDLLEAEGIRTIFGIPDPNFVHLFHSAHERGWDVIAPHHEAAAGFMAEAVARLNGTPAVCIGNQGPGVANLAPAIMSAMVEHSPVIFIGGQRARPTEQRVRRGRIQFVRQLRLFENWVKYAASVEYADQTDEIFREGLRVAQAGTPGPVYIEFPIHVVQQEVDVPQALPATKYRLSGQTAGPEQISAAVDVIRAARQPIILAGHAVHTSRAGAAVRALAEAVACPIIQTSGGTSYIPGAEDRTFSYGFSDAGVDAVMQSDVCIAIGTELGEPVHNGVRGHWAANDSARKWILVEQDPGALGVNRAIDVPLVGDLRAIVPQLVDALAATPRTPSPQLQEWIDQDAAQVVEAAASAPSGRSPIHPARLIVEATKAFPADGIMVRDGGATTIFGWSYSQARPHDVLWNQNFGHLGTGIPYAIGAGVADGARRPIMLISGDSAFQFHIAELETAARLNLPMVCVVAVDYAWGLEVGVYKRSFDRSTQPGAHWSDHTRLDRVAEGFGCHGEFIEREEDIAPAIEAAYRRGGTTVLHVVVDPDANSEQLPRYAEFSTWYAE